MKNIWFLINIAIINNVMIAILMIEFMLQMSNVLINLQIKFISNKKALVVLSNDICHRRM